MLKYFIYVNMGKISTPLTPYLANLLNEFKILSINE